jgi:hypothetical protein
MFPMRPAEILLNLASKYFLLQTYETYVDLDIVPYSRSSTIVGVYSKYLTAVAMVDFFALPPCCFCERK